MVNKGRAMTGAAVAAGLLLSMAALSGANDVQLTLSPKKLSNAGYVMVSVSGLEPEQEAGIRTMMGDVTTDVSYLVEPSLEKVDKNGAFAGIWNIDKNTLKVMKPGNYMITVVDESGESLASAELMIEKGKRSKESGE